MRSAADDGRMRRAKRARCDSLSRGDAAVSWHPPQSPGARASFTWGPRLDGQGVNLARPHLGGEERIDGPVPLDAALAPEALGHHFNPEMSFPLRRGMPGLFQHMGVTGVLLGLIDHGKLLRRERGLERAADPFRHRVVLVRHLNLFVL